MSAPIAIVGVPTALGVRDDGDLAIEPGFREGPDRRAANRTPIADRDRTFDAATRLMLTALGPG